MHIDRPGTSVSLLRWHIFLNPLIYQVYSGVFKRGLSELQIFTSWRKQNVNLQMERGLSKIIDIKMNKWKGHILSPRKFTFTKNGFQIQDEWCFEKFILFSGNLHLNHLRWKIFSVKLVYDQQKWADSEKMSSLIKFDRFLWRQINVLTWIAGKKIYIPCGWRLSRLLWLGTLVLHPSYSHLSLSLSFYLSLSLTLFLFLFLSLSLSLSLFLFSPFLSLSLSISIYLYLSHSFLPSVYLFTALAWL